MQPVINKRLVEKHFSQNAHCYDQFTPVQDFMANRLIKLVGSCQQNYPVTSILEFGCGTGRLTRLLLKNFPNCKIIAIDISVEMIERLKHSIPNNSNVDFIVGDAEVLVNDSFIRSRKFDLIISNATVQWFNHPQNTAKRYQSLLSNTGILAFSTFGPDTFCELRHAFRQAERRLRTSPMNHVLSFVSPEDWRILGACVQRRNSSVQEEHQIESFGSVKDFLYTIKKTGAANPYSKYPPIMSTNLFKCMVEEYERRYSTATSSGKIHATFHMVYVLSYPKA